MFLFQNWTRGCPAQRRNKYKFTIAKNITYTSYTKNLDNIIIGEINV